MGSSGGEREALPLGRDGGEGGGASEDGGDLDHCWGVVR